MVDMTDPSQFMASRVQQLVAQGMSRDQAVAQARAEMSQAGIGGAQGGPNVDMQALLGDKPSGGFQGSLDGQGLYADRGTPWFDAPIVQPQGASPQGAPPSGAGSGAAPAQGPAPQEGAPPQAGPQAPSAPAGAASGAPIAPAPPISAQARDDYSRTAGPPPPGAKGPNAPAAPGGPQAGPTGAPVPPPPPGNGAPAQAAPGAQTAARNENVYGYRPNDNFESWAYRTLQQGLADNGNSPYLAQNPMANNPWDSWLRSRYGMQQASGNLMQTMTGAVNPSDAAMQGMAGLAKGSTGGDMVGGLHNIADLETKVMGGNASGMDPSQMARLQQLNSAPDQVKAMILGAYTQKYGMLGSDIMRQKLDSAEQMFTNDPSNQGAQTTPFFNYALGKLGM